MAEKTDEVLDGAYKYRLSKGGASSDKYGLCEVCGGYVSDVYLQTESRWYAFEHHDVKHSGFTQTGCKSLFGHSQCLISKRRFPCLLQVAEKNASSPMAGFRP